ncbi:MAG: pseudouridine synthase [Prevotellaceae bacterium]|jgi:23S rRNA pseudouridine2605 synthase|nr:pseudouridine synthase [Prevotellaceae bacterium]
MENNQEEPKVYRPRTGSMERKKTAAAATGDAELPADGAEPKPRARAHTEDEEQPAGRATARQSFFKNRTSPSEAYPDAANDAGFNPKPRRAPRATPSGEYEKPRRRAAGKSAGERPKKSSEFEEFYREKPRSERRASGRGRAGEGSAYDRKPYRDEEPRSERRPFGRGRAGEGGAYNRKPYRDEEPRSERRPFGRGRAGEGSAYDRRPYRDEEPRGYRTKKLYDERAEKPRRERPFEDRQRYGSDRSEKPYPRKPYADRDSYESRSARPRAERKPVREIQVKEPNMPVRLNKFIANSGVCSRREADEYIQNGEITVNGEVVTTLGAKVLPTDDIRWNGDKLSGERKVYIVLNKPKGYVTTVEDPHADKTVMDLIADACSERVYPVGRLDKNTTGVLLFTNDGELTKTLTHPSYNKRKVYQVTLNKTLKKPDMEQLVEGVELEDGLAVADEVGYTNMEDKTEVGLEIHSGRNRVVRRMFEALGYEVKKLDRVYFAGLTKKSLERGKWRMLSPKEVSILKMGAYE